VLRLARSAPHPEERRHGDLAQSDASLARSDWRGTPALPTFLLVAEAVDADFPGSNGVGPWAMDPEQAERLWRKSEEWTGVLFAV
jgi:hypothetical protein